jgi:hypothetical protein
MEPNNKTMKVVYTIVTRGEKSYWTRVGVGFENRDGSLNLKLDAIPTNGTLQVREWEPFREAPGAPTHGPADPLDGPPRPAIRRRDEALA